MVCKVILLMQNLHVSKAEWDYVLLRGATKESVVELRQPSSRYGSKAN